DRMRRLQWRNLQLRRAAPGAGAQGASLSDAWRYRGNRPRLRGVRARRRPPLERNVLHRPLGCVTPGAVRLARPLWSEAALLRPAARGLVLRLGDQGRAGAPRRDAGAGLGSAFALPLAPPRARAVHHLPRRALATTGRHAPLGARRTLLRAVVRP